MNQSLLALLHPPPLAISLMYMAGNSEIRSTIYLALIKNASKFYAKRRGSHKSAPIAPTQCITRRWRNPRIQGLRRSKFMDCVTWIGATPWYKIEHCSNAVLYTVSTQCANRVRRASLKNGAMGALLCDPNFIVKAHSKEVNFL